MSLNVTSVFLVFLFFASSPALFGQYSEGFDAGNRGQLQQQCWFFSSTTVYSGPAGNLPVNGPAVRTGQLTNMRNPHTLGTPCTWFTGSVDTLRFSHFVHHLGGSTLKRLDVVVVDESDRVQDTLLTHIYTHTQAVATKLPMRVLGSFRIEWRWIGQGGTGRAFLDDVTVPGLYAADPVANCSCTGNPFPVEWGDFRVAAVGGQARLEWETLSELNASHFVIQRSADGHLFEVAGQVAAQGFSDVPVAYTFTDAPERPCYYRLQQVDLDGLYSYSPVLRWTPDARRPQLTLMPGAGTSLRAQWTLPAAGAGHLIIRDMQGRVCLEQTLTDRAGEQALPTHRWTPGLYIAQLVQGQSAVSQKWIVH